MGAQRAFEPTQVERGDKRVRGFKIVCGQCGGVAREPVNTFAGGGAEREHRQAKEKFQRLGWVVGETERQDRCPRCVEIAAAAEVRRYKDRLRLVSSTPEDNKRNEDPVMKPAPTAEAPREMTREDRRIIFEKLNEVYGDEKTGYTAHWTDKLVAQDLGVPQAWVAKVRDEMFGPEGDNAAMREEIAKAREVMAKVRELLDAVEHVKGIADRQMKRVEEIVREVAPLQAQMDKTMKMISAIEKAVRP